jgi:hypothetical protein
LRPAIFKRNVFLAVRRLAAFTVECAFTKVAVARIVVFLTLAAILLVVLRLPPSARTDQPAYDTVGAIEGEDVAVQGPLKIEVVQGRTKTILRSGSDIRVNSGQAQIDLVEGGKIAICGPAHLSVLKSVNLLTLALDIGTIHARVERLPELTVYTPQIQAKPIAIGDAPQDTLVGFDQAGAMCIRADSGAVRVEQQLTAQSLVVPQGGDILIANGQLDTVRSGTGHCTCELQGAQTPPPLPEISRLATPQEIESSKRETKTSPEAPKPAKEDPVYQVFMPPLSYDATAKVQPDNFDPQLIVLVRRIRVRPTLIFQGRVTEAPAVPKNTPPPAPAKAPETPPPQTQQAQPSIFARIRAFFRSLFS